MTLVETTSNQNDMNVANNDNVDVMKKDIDAKTGAEDGVDSENPAGSANQSTNQTTNAKKTRRQRQREKKKLAKQAAAKNVALAASDAGVQNASPSTTQEDVETTDGEEKMSKSKARKLRRKRAKARQNANSETPAAANVTIPKATDPAPVVTPESTPTAEKITDNLPAATEDPQPTVPKSAKSLVTPAVTQEVAVKAKTTTVPPKATASANQIESKAAARSLPLTLAAAYEDDNAGGKDDCECNACVIS